MVHSVWASYTPQLLVASAFYEEACSVRDECATDISLRNWLMVGGSIL
jgi:hypothetical protein